MQAGLSLLSQAKRPYLPLGRRRPDAATAAAPRNLEGGVFAPQSRDGLGYLDTSGSDKPIPGSVAQWGVHGARQPGFYGCRGF